MANTHSTLTELFSAIANAVRAKTGKTETIIADNFPSEIDSIEVRPENTCYIGTAVPEDTFGKDGDIFIVKEG